MNSFRFWFVTTNMQRLTYQRLLCWARGSDGANLTEVHHSSSETIVDSLGLCCYDDPVLVWKEMKRK